MHAKTGGGTGRRHRRPDGMHERAERGLRFMVDELKAIPGGKSHASRREWLGRAWVAVRS